MRKAQNQYVNSDLLFSENKINIKKEALRLANKPLYDYDNEAFIIEHNVISFKSSAAGKSFGDVIIPEGVIALDTQIFGIYKSLIFPSTFRVWTTDR